MLYSEYINKVIEETITEADNGLFYLEPMWRSILHDNHLFFNSVSDAQITPEEVLEVLKLEVKKRNTEHSLEPYIHNWIHDIITASVEPAIMQEETDYLKNLTEYLKANKEAQSLKDKEDWENFTKQ
jgi:hypothetical protein